jgi:TRAP-type mannitol/chloroaromatic compound transport system permease small subunit
VFSRFFFDETKAWVMELEWHFFALTFLLGAGYTLRHDRHVRVDVFYTRFPKKDKALVNIIGSLILLIPWTILLMIVSWNYAVASYQIGEGSPDPGGLPARYIIKFSIVLGFFLLFLQAVSELLKAWNDFKQRSTE